MSSNITSWAFNKVNNWLKDLNLDMYSNNFQKYDINGYDLFSLNNDDFIQLKISNFHDKNLILKSIKMKVLEQLKIKINYESKIIEIQLDFDPNLTVEKLCNDLSKIFSINEEIFLSINNGNCILMPTVKIIELIILEPEKYKNFKIITKKNLKFSNHNNDEIYKDYNKNYKNDYFEDEKINNYKSKSFLIENQFDNFRNSNSNINLENHKNKYKYDYIHNNNYKESNYYTPPPERELNDETSRTYTPNDKKRKINIKELKRESSYNTLNFIYGDNQNKNYLENDLRDEKYFNNNNKISSSQNRVNNLNEGKIINKMYNKIKEVNKNNQNYYINKNLENKELSKKVNNNDKMKYENEYNYKSNYEKEYYNNNYLY